MSFLSKVDKLLGTATKNLGEVIEFRPAKGGRCCINAVFDKQYEAIDPNTEQVVTSNQPVIGIRLRDLPFKPLTDDFVIARDIKYKVVDIQEDGLGGAVLFLHNTE